MILIHRVSCKNFLSYGNAVTGFDLATHKATLIRGKNGHGKSVILDLLLFALYGRPYRAINKPQLVNSINRGDMLVEIDFSISGVEYKVRRGIRPNVFDIFRGEELIEQDAAIRDYQDFLEKQILRMPERTFKQIAVLGSASYVPFMKLQAFQRRELVESILDIEIFSVMNVLLKERINSTREEYNRISINVDSKKKEAIAQQKLINVIEENKNQRVDDHQSKRASIQAQIDKNLARMEDIHNMMANTPVPKWDVEAYAALHANILSAEGEIKSYVKRKEKIKVAPECPTCLQSVKEKHVHLVNKEFDSLIDKQKKKLADYQKKLDKLLPEKETYEAVNKRIQELDSEYKNLDREITQYKNQMFEYDKTIIDILADTSNIEAEKEKLKRIGAEALSMIERKNTLSEEKHLQDVAQQLLKDSGIKTAVVKEYLPVLNTLINKYLAMFDFFVDFTLDESFEEVIRSRGRDVFSYSSFSEGEKRRIDFAILMAFRQLAALKNSAKTNILILDEIVDGAFDLDARVAFNDMLSSIPNSNIIVISHADASTEQYDRVIQVEKVGDFSTYAVME